MGNFAALLLATVAAIAALATAWFVYLQVQRMHDTILISQRSMEASLLLAIAARMNELYSKRNKVIQKPVVWAEFDSAYPSLESKLNSAEWLLLREVGGFYEFLGVLVRRGHLSITLVSDVIHIDLGIWEKCQETIEAMRQAYSPRLWENWQFLITEARKQLTYGPGPDEHLPSARPL